MVPDGRAALYHGRSSDGQSIERPMSPHLSIYRARLSMVLSISNRIAGVFSAFGTGLAAAWLGSLAQGSTSYARTKRFMHHPAGRVILAGWGVATLYHFVAGVRHLIWDRGERLEKSQVNADGRISIGITVGTATALIGMFVWLSRQRRKG